MISDKRDTANVDPLPLKQDHKGISMVTMGSTMKTVLPDYREYRKSYFLHDMKSVQCVKEKDGMSILTLIGMA